MVVSVKARQFAVQFKSDFSGVASKSQGRAIIIENTQTTIESE